MLSGIEPQNGMPRSGPGQAGPILRDMKGGADFAAVLAGEAEAGATGPASDKGTDATDDGSEAGYGPVPEADADETQSPVAPVAPLSTSEDRGDGSKIRNEIGRSVHPDDDADGGGAVAAADTATTGREDRDPKAALPAAAPVTPRDAINPSADRADQGQSGRPTKGADVGVAPDPSAPPRAAVAGQLVQRHDGAAPAQAGARGLSAVAHPVGLSPEPEGKPVAEMSPTGRRDASSQAGAPSARPQVGEAWAGAAPGLLQAGPSAIRARRLSAETTRPAFPMAKAGAPGSAQTHTGALAPGVAAVPRLFRSNGAFVVELARLGGKSQGDPMSLLSPETEGRRDMPGPGQVPLSGALSGPVGDLPLAGARQVAAAIARTNEQGRKSIELRLSPEELGTVRLRLDGAGDALSISVQAERGETLDLLRRNIDLLSQQLRDIGYDNARFVFSQYGSQDGSPSGKAHVPIPASLTEEAAPGSPQEGVPSSPQVLVLGDRLDIRL